MKPLAETFGVGAAFCYSLSSLDGERHRAYGKKPRVNAAAHNQEGTWGVGLSNYTSPTFTDMDAPRDFALHNSGYAAQIFFVTVRVPVRPLELVTLRSERAAR